MEGTLVNFEFPLHPSASPIRATFHGRRIVISPHEYYEEHVQRLNAIGGIAPTAVVTIPSATNLSDKWIRSTFASLMSPLSLSRSTKVACSHYVTLDEAKHIRAIVHWNAVTRSFSGNASGLGLRVSPTRLVEAWGARSFAPPIPLDELRRRIEQYIDACSIGLYLESRTLIGATVIEPIAKPLYRSAHSATATNKASLRDLLDFATQQLSIPRRGNKTVTNTRNTLAHQARFHAAPGASRAYLKENAFVLWTAFALLTRTVDPAIRLPKVFNPNNPKSFREDYDDEP